MQTFKVDIEHAGIRIALPVIMLGVGFGLWFGLAAPIDPVMQGIFGIDGLGGITAALLGLVCAVIAGFIADYVLKSVWPSGRVVTLTGEQLTLVDDRRGDRKNVTLALDKRINPLQWRFTVKRSTPKAQAGWVMLGMQLAQDEAQMTIYTFVPAKQIKDDPLVSPFVTLITGRELEKTKLSMRESAEQRRLTKAEAERWTNGAELRPDDFFIILNAIRTDPHASDT